MFTEALDLNAFYRQGYLVTDIALPSADALLAEIEKEAWVWVVPEDNEGEQNPYARTYQSRFVAADSLLRPTAIRPEYAAYRDAFRRWASPIFERFDHADQSLVTALAGGEGYEMDLHADAGDRSLFTTLLYLGHAACEPNEHGGELELVRVDAHNPHGGEQAVLERVVPVHGRLVVMNNLDPTVYHRVLRYTRTDRLRYQVFGSFGINDTPDWHFDTQVPEVWQGQCINPDRPLTMADVEDVARRLRQD